VKIAEDHYVYADWKPGTYTIKLDPAGGGYDPEKFQNEYGGREYLLPELTGKGYVLTATYAEKIYVLPRPTRAGYEFDGWYTAKTGGEPVPLGDWNRFTRDQTIYARWIPQNVLLIINYQTGNYIENKLFLKVNREKTAVSYIRGVRFLGHSFRIAKRGIAALYVHPKSVAKMKAKIRELTNRSNGWSNDYRKRRIKQYVTGWVQYFRLAGMKTLLRSIDEWMRHRIRALIWKQWKKTRTKYRNLRKLGSTTRGRTKPRTPARNTGAQSKAL